jgi:hypothetical protein
VEYFAPLIWIEADRKPAKYFLNSLKIHNELFPLAKKVVITNSKYFESYNNSKVELIAIESLGTDKYLNKFESINKKWSAIENQLIYWTNTTKRFFYLYLYLKKTKSLKAIHLEGDCIMIADKNVLDKLKSPRKAIYYPRQSESVGCAEIFLVNGLEPLEKLLKYINLNWSKPEKTDMTLLGEFLNKGEHAQSLISNPEEDLSSECIYDAGLIARYFLGSEARNHRLPFSRRGILNLSEAAFNPSFYKILRGNSNKLILKNIITNKTLILGTLHIHNKKVPKKIDKLFKSAIRESEKKRGFFWKLGKLDYIVLLERLLSKMSVIFKGYENKEIRFR